MNYSEPAVWYPTLKYVVTFTHLPPRISDNDFILVHVVFGGGKHQVGEFNVASGRIIGKVRDENSPKYTVQGRFRLHSRYNLGYYNG